MTRMLRLTTTFVIALLFVTLPATAQDLELLHYWNFNEEELEDALLPTFSATGLAAHSIENTFNRDNDVSLSGTATDLNARFDDPAGSSLLLRPGTGDGDGQLNDGSHLQLQVSTLGHENIKLKYATRRTGNGFETQRITFRVGDADGDFTLAEEIAVSNEFEVGEFGLVEIGFASPDLADAEDVFIRIVFDDAVSGFGNSSVDNITVEGVPLGEETGPIENVTQGTFHDTIQDAIDAADSGDTIAVSAGTYEESLTIDVDGLTLEATNDPRPVVVGQSRNAVAIAASNVSVDGLEIQNPIGTGDSPGSIGARGIVIQSGGHSGVAITNNVITNIGTEADTNPGGIFAFDGADDLTIDGNTITLLAGTEADEGQAQAILLIEEGDAPIQNATVSNNTISDVSDTRSAVAIRFNGDVSGDIAGNTITGLRTDGPAGTGFTQAIALSKGANASAAPSNVTITDNTVAELEVGSVANFAPPVHLILSSVADVGSIEISDNSFTAETLEEVFVADQTLDVDLNPVLLANTYSPNAILETIDGAANLIVPEEEDDDSLVCPTDPNTPLLSKYGVEDGEFVFEKGSAGDSVTFSDLTRRTDDPNDILEGNWTIATGLVSQTIVETAQESNVSSYDPAVSSSSFTTEGLDNEGGQQPAVSGINFCGFVADCPDPLVVNETLDSGNQTLTVTFSSGGPDAGLEVIDFTTLTNLEVGEAADGFILDNGPRYIFQGDPADAPEQAVFVLNGVPPGDGESNGSFEVTYFAEITNTCGGEAEIDPIHQLTQDDTSAFTLEGSYPNPFRGQTTLRFTLPETAPVTISVFDVMGRKIATLAADELLSEGAHEIQWDGRSTSGRPLASGVYFVRLESNGQLRTQRVTIAR